MTGTVAPFPKHQIFDNNGIPAVGAKLFTYLAGTATKVNTYTESTLSSANTNPIVLDTAGRATIFLTPGVSYKFVLAPSTDTDPPVSPIWTVDDVQAVPLRNSDVDVTGTAGTTITAGQCVYLSAGDGSLTAGSWYPTNAGTIYKGSGAIQIGFATTAGTAATSVTVRIKGRVTGLAGLTPGATYYTDNSAGNITTSFVTSGGVALNNRAVGEADTTTSLIILENQACGQALFEVAPHYRPGQNLTSGVTTFTGVVNGTLTANVDTADVPNGTTVETTLSTFTTVANLMTGSTKGTLRVSFSWTIAANGNTKTVRFYFGGTAVTVYTGAQNGGTGHAEMWVTRTGNSTQKITGFMSAVNAAGTGTTASFSTTSAETMANNIVVKTTGQSGTASSDIIQNMFIPEILAL